MDANEVLNVLIDSDDDLDSNESSAESSEDEEQARNQTFLEGGSKSGMVAHMKWAL